VAFNGTTGSTSDNPDSFTATGTTDNPQSVTLAFDPSGGVSIVGFTTKLQDTFALGITTTGAGATQGTGTVVISDIDDIDSVNAEVQTIDSWADAAITVDPVTLPTGVVPGDTVYVFVTNDDAAVSDSSTIAVADMVLRVGSADVADDILDTDTGIAIASEALTKMAVMNTALTTILGGYSDASITVGKLEYVDPTLFNIDTEDDVFSVVINAGTNRLYHLPGTCVDRNED
jgi:hypothetical protein